MLMQLKATITEADEGTFVALASTYSTDRQNERVVPGSFRETLRVWMDSGKMIPLAWDHGRGAEDIIGSIDPASVAETNEGLKVEASLDIEDSERAREAWRSVKGNRVGLSFGYLVKESRTGEDGATELTELDLFEITLTSTPANGDTRVLNFKDMSGTWFPSPSDYDDQEWAEACVLDRADCSELMAEAPAKERYALPITDPGADEANPVALAPTAAALAGDPNVIGNVCDKAIELAKARLLAAYDEAEVEPPASLTASESSVAVRTKSAPPTRIFTFPIND